MILGINWYNRRLCFALRSKKLREDTILFWSRISTCLPSYVRDAIARWVHNAFDLIDYGLLCNVYLDTSIGALPSDRPVLIAMSHPGLDERLLLQHISARYCGGRRAIAASNLIDPNTKKEYSGDFMRFMELNGVLSHRLKAIMEKKSTLETSSPGSANDVFFESMVDVLKQGDNVIFAPEGETNPWPSLKPFKNGIVRVATRYASQTRRSISIVPVACHFIATGAYSRDAIVRIGPSVDVRYEDIPYILTGDDANGTSNDFRGYVAKLTAQLREGMGGVYDTVPYDIAPMAPHHNGRSDLEKADAYLLRQLCFQDTLSNLISAAFVLLSNRSFQNCFKNCNLKLMDDKDKALWRCKAIQRLGHSLRSNEAAVEKLGDSFTYFDSKFRSLVELVSKSDECPVVMQTLPVDYCARRFKHLGLDLQNRYTDTLSAAEGVYLRNADFFSCILLDVSFHNCL